MNNPTHAFIYEYQKRLISGYLKKKITIIDFGCGSGDMLRTIPSSQIRSYSGYDINPESIQEARRIYKGRKNIRFYLFDAKKPFRLRNSKKADFILMIGVIQYLTDHEIISIFTECRNCLKKTGCMIISTCSDHYAYKLIDMYGFVSPHRYFSSTQLASLVHQSGYKILERKEIGLIVAPFFSYCLSLVFDGLDILLRTKKKGALGSIGEWARRTVAPIILKEYAVQQKIGYTHVAIVQPKL